MKRLLLTLAALVPALVFAQETAPRPKIGLALGGGGAKGYAHIGVLKSLEEMQIPVDYIAGTSMGAVIGSLYASGKSADEVAAMAASIDWADALQDDTPYPDLIWRRKEIARRYASSWQFGVKNRRIVMPSGLRTGQRLRFLLSRHLMPALGVDDFDRLPIPFRAVAADIETGQPVVLSRGDLPSAVRASMSIPGAFTPVEYDGRILVDGGIVMNLPVDVVRAMGADIVIAVDVGDVLQTREQLNSAVAIVGQLSTLLAREHVNEQAARADILLTPDITGIQGFDFERHEEIIPRGTAAAEAHREELAKLAVSAEEYDAITARQTVLPAPAIVIDAIEISGEKNVDERVIRRLIRTRVGQPLDLDRIQEDIDRIYGLGEFIRVSFGIIRAGDKRVLHIAVREKPWGPHYGRAGLTMTATGTSEVDVQILAGLHNTRINPRGAEWKLDVAAGVDPRFFTEFMQPLDFDGLHFVSVSATAEAREIKAVVDGQAIAIYDLHQQRLNADYGVRLGNYGEARLGLINRWSQAEKTVGMPGLADADDRDGGFHLFLGIDHLDTPFVPTNGASLVLDAHYMMKAFGSDGDYGRAALAASYYKTWGRHTLLTGIGAGSWLGARQPAYDVFVMGGFFNLSAYDPGYVVDYAAGLARLGYYYKLADRSAAIGGRVYAGGVIEAGSAVDAIGSANEGDRLWSGMALIAIDSAIGPVYLGYAVGENNQKNFYLTIGKTF